MKGYIRDNQTRILMSSKNPEKHDEEEERELADIYSILKQDAKSIIFDLKGGVTMWREAAAGAAASTGFILIFILNAFRYTPPGSSLEGWAYIIGSGIVAVVMAIFSVIGFRRYFHLKRKYKSLFERAEKL